MKKIMSSVVAALVALSFSAFAFAAEGSAPVDEPAPVVEKKEVKKGRTVKAKKSKRCAAKKANKNEKKEETTVAEPEAE